MAVPCQCGPQKRIIALENFFLFWVPMNIYKDWKAKLESAYSFMLKYSKITVCFRLSAKDTKDKGGTRYKDHVCKHTLLCEKRQNPLKFKGKPFVIFVNMKIHENLNENTPPKDFPLKSKEKM